MPPASFDALPDAISNSPPAELHLQEQPALDEIIHDAEMELNFLRRFGNSDEDNYTVSATEKLEQARQLATQTELDPATRAHYTAQISATQTHVHLESGNLDAAIESAQPALDYYQANPHAAPYESAQLYDALSTRYLDRATSTADTSPRSAEADFDKAVHFRRLNETVNEGTARGDAIRVEQSEVGFSSKAPIGTDNIQECAALAIRDQNGRVALAHVDYSTSAESLNRILEHIDTTGPLEAKVIGGRLYDEKGQRNLDVIDKFTTDHNITVTAASIEGHPSAIVIDPTTFEVTSGVPTRPSATTDIQNGLAAWMNDEGQQKPIHLGFDETTGQHIEPVNIHPHQIERLNPDLLGKSPLQTYLVMEQSGTLPQSLTDLAEIHAVHQAVHTGTLPSAPIPQTPEQPSPTNQPETNSPPTSDIPEAPPPIDAQQPDTPPVDTPPVDAPPAHHTEIPEAHSPPPHLGSPRLAMGLVDSVLPTTKGGIAMTTGVAITAGVISGVATGNIRDGFNTAAEVVNPLQGAVNQYREDGEFTAAVAEESSKDVARTAGAGVGAIAGAQAFGALGATIGPWGAAGGVLVGGILGGVAGEETVNATIEWGQEQMEKLNFGSWLYDTLHPHEADALTETIDITALNAAKTQIHTHPAPEEDPATPAGTKPQTAAPRPPSRP